MACSRLPKKTGSQMRGMSHQGALVQFSAIWPRKNRGWPASGWFTQSQYLAPRRPTDNTTGSPRGRLQLGVDPDPGLVGMDPGVDPGLVGADPACSQSRPHAVTPVSVIVSGRAGGVRCYCHCLMLLMAVLVGVAVLVGGHRLGLHGPEVSALQAGRQAWNKALHYCCLLVKSGHGPSQAASHGHICTHMHAGSLTAAYTHAHSTTHTLPQPHTCKHSQ